MRRMSGLVVSAVLVMVATGVVFASPAAASHVACGQVITQDTTLDGDVGPCANNGIVIGADNITLNLNGYRVFCTPPAGDGAAVLVRLHTGVTVTRGTVSDCDGGVVILGGGNNSVTWVTARNNVGGAFGHAGPPVTPYGDGILVQGSSRNRIAYNTADNNGPYSGIAIITGDSDHPAIPPALANENVLSNNLVTNSQACRSGSSPFCDNDGIRIEPRVGSGCLSGPVICPGPGNRITDNTVVNSSLDGISLFGFTTANYVARNQVSLNGFTGAVRGDGIRVFGSANTVEGNSVDRNANGGVSVARRPPSAGSFPATNPNGRNNTLLRNSARGNAIDLWDSNRSPDCDNNQWHGNVGSIANPPCTLNP